jgi:shikimate kinase
MKIYIIGMPGSGKTYIGKKLSLSLKLKYSDLDLFIENKASQTIRQIIKERGESDFRILETEALKSFETEKNIVISCGGGTPMFYDNMDYMKKSGVVIWINTDLKTVSQRIQKNITRRPQFEGLDIDEIQKKIADLFLQRQKTYKKADIEIKNFGKQNNVLTSVIQQLIKFEKLKR